MSAYVVQPTVDGYSEVHEFNREAPLHVIYVGCSGCGELLDGRIARVELDGEHGMLHENCVEGLEEEGIITHTNSVAGQILLLLLPV